MATKLYPGDTPFSVYGSGIGPSSSNVRVGVGTPNTAAIPVATLLGLCGRKSVVKSGPVTCRISAAGVGAKLTVPIPVIVLVIGEPGPKDTILADAGMETDPS